MSTVAGEYSSQLQHFTNSLWLLAVIFLGMLSVAQFTYIQPRSWEKWSHFCKTAHLMNIYLVIISKLKPALIHTNALIQLYVCRTSYVQRVRLGSSVIKVVSCVFVYMHFLVSKLIVEKIRPIYRRSFKLSCQPMWLG